MQRKNFLRLIPGFTLAGAGFALTAYRQRAEPLDPGQVQAFVAAGHNDLTKVKAMLAEMPALIHGAHDWGGGDVETALEGAGHVGNRAIAEYLIGRGARPNLFVLCMLGQTEVVLGQLDAYPALLRARGPHGYTLLHHAKVGGEAAAELFAALQERGLDSFQEALP